MIEKIFTSKNRVKILGFLFFKKNKSYIREISRELKIPVSAVKKETDNLLSVGIIKLSDKRIVLEDNCNFLGDLKNIFIKTDFIVYPLKEALLKIDAEFIFIFGSFANGAYSNESDIDLFVVGNIKPSKVYELIKRAEEIIKRSINPVVWTYENLKKEKDSGFVKDVFKKKIIMIKGDENELRRIIE
ncbi:nucleotidyltransferase domain-containing protein [Candidatus Pacearchaeota archaeon]|nr:nucleotidyltransferase domain-containing protein [Candidatus Pacearchaeota archaeon]